MLIVPHAASLTSAALVRRHGRYGMRQPGRRSKVIKWSAAPGYGPSPSIPRPFWINFNFENIVALASSLATVGIIVADTQRLMSPQHTPVSQGPTKSFPILLGPAHATSFDASSEGGRGKAWLAFVGAVFAMGMAGGAVMVSGARAGSSSSSGNGDGGRSGRGRRRNNGNRLPVRGSSPPPPPQGPPSPSISTSSNAVRPIRPRDKCSKRRGSSDPDPPPGGGGTSLGVYDGKKEILLKGVFVGLFWWVCKEAVRKRGEDEDEDEGGQEQEEEKEDDDVICTDVIVHSTANVKEYSFDFLNPTVTTDFISLDDVASLTGSDIEEMNMDDIVDALLNDESSPSPSPPAPMCTFDIPPVPSTLLVASNAKVNPTSLNNTNNTTITTNSVPAKPSKVGHILKATTLITVLWIGYLAILCWRVVYGALCRVVRRVGYGVHWVCRMAGMGRRAMGDVEGDADSEDERRLSDGEDDDEDDGGGGWDDGDEDDDGGGDGDEIPEWSFDSEGEEVVDEEDEQDDMYGVEDVEQEEEEEEEDIDLEQYLSLLLDLEECDLEQYLPLLSDDDEEEEGRYRYGARLGVILEEEEEGCEGEVAEAVEEEDDLNDIYGDVCVYTRDEEPQHAEEQEEHHHHQEEEDDHQDEDEDVSQRASSSSFAYHWHHLRPSTPLSPTTSTYSEYTSSVPHSPECRTPLSLPSLPSLQSVLSELSGDKEDEEEESGGSAAPVLAQLGPGLEPRSSPSRVPPSRSLSPVSLPTPAPAHSSVPQCAQRTPPRPPITSRSIPLPLSPTPTPRSVSLPPSPTADTNSNADTNETEDPNTKTIPEGRRRRIRRRKRRGG